MMQKKQVLSREVESLYRERGLCLAQKTDDGNARVEVGWGEKEERIGETGEANFVDCWKCCKTF